MNDKSFVLFSATTYDAGLKQIFMKKMFFFCSLIGRFYHRRHSVVDVFESTFIKRTRSLNSYGTKRMT